MKLEWKTRVGLVLSAVWVCLVFLIADEDRRAGTVLGLACLPLIMLWGIVWAISGWRAQRSTKPEFPEAVILETKRKRNHRLKMFVVVMVVLAIGLLAATWQFRAADNQAGANVISYWFGECLVYGLLAYGVLRLVPKAPPGFPAVFAAIVVVGGVNYKTFSAISEEREARISLAKASPLISKLQSGALVNDQEIKDAQVGIMEPLLLAEAAYNRDVIAITAAYTKAAADLQPELILAPASLASPGIREQTRAKLKVWQRSTTDYKSQMDAAMARAELGVQAAQVRMPAAIAEGASKGFGESSAQVRAYIGSFVNSESEAIGTITAILDLMDSNPGGYVVDKGPPSNLLFRDQATLTRFRQLTAAIMATSQREAEARSSLLEFQASRIDKLTDLLKRRD